MKKTFTLFASLSCMFLLGITTSRAQSSSTSQGGNPAPQFMTDITVEANMFANQRHVRIGAAFNGWVFAAYLVNDSVSQKGGVVVRYSKNGGINWLPMNSYPYYDHSIYTNCDLTIVGKDSTNLAVFVGMSREDLITKKYEVEVLKYTPYHTAFPPTVTYFQQLDTNKVMDLALTNDYKTPATGDLTYGLGLLYDHHGPVTDSLIFVTTKMKSSNLLGKSRVLATAPHLRKITLAFSSSQTAHKGTYLAAWESLDSTKSVFGHIMLSRTVLRTDSVWTTPTFVDSLNPSFGDMLRSPSLAAQYNNNDNDSTNATGVIVFEAPRNGHADSLDILGFYNKRCDSTDFWNSFTLAASTDNEKQPNVNFDASNNQFLVTYYDSTTGGISYATQLELFTTPSSWTTVNAHCNDNTANLKAPWPRVVINPLSKKAFLAWVIEATNKNGVVKCDGEYLFTGIEEAVASGLSISMPYPNPASSQVLISLQSTQQTDLRLSLYNLLGEQVGNDQKIHLVGGEQQIALSVNELASGVYICSMESENFKKTFRLVVQH
jgi:hypothetical protein